MGDSMSMSATILSIARSRGQRARDAPAQPIPMAVRRRPSHSRPNGPAAGRARRRPADANVYKKSVPVRYDPLDAGHVYAYVAGRWVTCISDYHARRAITTVVTDNSRSWHDRDAIALDTYLMRHGIEHMYESLANPRTRGTVERILARFGLYLGGMAVTVRDTVTVEGLQAACDLWAYHQCNRHTID